METSAVLTFSVLFTFMFFILGGIIGWIVKQSQYENMYGIPNLHPEMFDVNGNLIPDEILSVRFENDYGYEDEDDE
tara:strand:+ start:1711 stop:1938 length:228 start_codon:yes stop_codon:yes gene_type:complete